MASVPTISDTSVVGRTLRRISEQSPKYGAKVTAELKRNDALFFHRAEHFLSVFERFLIASGRDLNYGIDCHLKLRDAMMEERMAFLRSGRYANSSFAEVEQKVYANPQIMEYHMYGLMFAQFFWPDQYARLDFFCSGLPQYRERVGRYLEIGGGHAIYISSAVELLGPETSFDLVDISTTSLNLARALSPNDRIRYHLCNIFEFPEGDGYDFIVAGEVLEHLEDPRKLLDRMRRMLTREGRAFITTPVNAPTVDHIYLFHNVQEIRDMLGSEGFVIESEATRYAEDLPDAQAAKLKVPQMFAAFLRTA
jgi:SAM-dependent methyltransferase